MKKIHTSVRLKEIMKERNLKQSDILRLTKPLCEFYNERLGKNDLSQYVSGKTEPGQYKLFILAKALNVSENWLMGLDVPKERTDNAAPDEKPTDEKKLTSEETTILNKYNQLNDLGQDKAEDYIDDLLGNDIYKKTSNGKVTEIPASKKNKKEEERPAFFKAARKKKGAVRAANENEPLNRIEDIDLENTEGITDIKDL